MKEISAKIFFEMETAVCLVSERDTMALRWKQNGRQIVKNEEEGLVLYFQIPVVSKTQIGDLY
jgi:hypothetical protein